MSDDLFSYLDVSGPEYDYLGHFRSPENLCRGHNDVEDTVAARALNPGALPGKNYAADQEPSDIAAETTKGMTPPADPMPTMGQMGSQKSSIMDASVKSAAVGGLKSLFGIP